MRIELDFEEVPNVMPIEMEWVIVRLKGGKTEAAYLSYNGTWYGNEGQPVSGVTHWAEFPWINIKNEK